MPGRRRIANRSTHTRVDLWAKMVSMPKRSSLRSSHRPSLRPLQQELTDIPNLVTLSRIGLIPFVLLLVNNDSPTQSAIACVLFVIASATDALDGYLARRMGLVTVLGKFLDPLADKIIVLSALIVLTANGRIPLWLVVVLLWRELAVNSLRSVAASEGLVIAAGQLGKWKTALQLAGISCLLLYFPYKLSLLPLVCNFQQVGLVLLLFSLVLSVLSAAQYFMLFAEAADRQNMRMQASGRSRAFWKQYRMRRRSKLRAYRKSRTQRQRRGYRRNAP